ncbi:CoA-transferase family III domain-containing protein [Rhexocercosporidium sp. MPI-PUGE-AT-0058]|nr:CoA-transferase family III domain-containing protein [Rhexocercosporidium sp. MPI-PUGE-AT-0058]
MSRVLPGSFCTQILADYVDGETATWGKEDKLSYYFAAVNRNKRSITLDVKKEEGKKILLSLGYDIIAAAEAGLLHITGERDGPPTKPGLALTDISTGLYTHGAIIAALQSRHRTGHGQKIDSLLFETQLSLLTSVATVYIVPYAAFKTRDSWLVCGAVNSRQFKTLLAALEGSGMPYGSVNDMERSFVHPQTGARGVIEEVEFEGLVGGKLRTVGVPVKFGDTKAKVRRAPPLLGEHIDEILREIGMDSGAIQRLRENGVV